MKAVYSGKRIRGILSVLPETEVKFIDEVGNYTFPEKQTLKLQRVMGFEQHRIVHQSTSTSDLCVFGLEHLLNKGLIKKDEIGALVVATTTPDHFIPPVSNIVQGKLGLSSDVICLDISQGCVAFLVGLMQAFLLLEHLGDKKVVVFAADVLSKKTSTQDRNSFPLIGDGAGIAVVENDIARKDIFTAFFNDGTKRDALIIPAGGSRMPCTAETAVRRDVDGDGNLRSLDDLTMQGSEVFSFVQTEVPPMVDDIIRYAGLTKDEIDWFLFHQPNKFMLRKLTEKLKVPYEKVPMNIVENFGNPSGASIPLVITHNLREQMLSQKQKCCLAAFGSGLSWGAMIMELGELDFCEMLFSNL